MLRLFIDGKAVEAKPGSTILAAAQAAGIEIPTLCYRPGFAPAISCMICAVRVAGVDRLLPACATPVENGMAVTSNSEEIQQIRRTNLELILSEHAGDCQGPCEIACPAGPDTPAILRAWQNSDFVQAIEIARRDLVLPATLGFVCPAPCERVCRRREFDAPVAIRFLHRYAGLEALRAALTGMRPPSPDSPTVAVVGAGPAGLAACAALAAAGIAAVIYEAEDRPGGGLRACVREGILPQSVLADECHAIVSASAKFVPNFRLAGADALRALCAQHAAVILAMGPDRPLPDLGLEMGAHGIAIQRDVYLTSLPGVYATGGAVQPIRRMAARAVAEGRAAANAAIAALRGGRVAKKADFRLSLGRLSPEEAAAFFALAKTESRAAEPDGEWTAQTTAHAAERCLHCDCRAKKRCGLRQAAALCGASAARYGHRRRRLEIDASHPLIIFEANKCINCGLCLEVSRQAGERVGLAWRGRGRNMRPAAALGKPLVQALEICAPACAAVCPTAALALRQTQTLCPARF